MVPSQFRLKSKLNFLIDKSIVHIEDGEIMINKTEKKIGLHIPELI